MRIKKFTFFTVVVLMLSFFSSTVSAVVTYEPEETEIRSESVYMVNLDMGTPIYAKDPDKILCPASLTKIMTAILVLEAIPEDQLETTIITCPAEILVDPIWQDASLGDFRIDEQVRAIDMLYALILASACEAGSVLADYVGREYYDGDMQTFIDRMNTKAKELGCENTHFANAHGLHDDQQYSTAYDMYLITQYALENPIFKEMSTSVDWIMPVTNKHAEQRIIVHTNYMTSFYRGGEYYYEYVKGIKTGTTSENTQNLVSMAENNGYTYLLVVFGGLDRDENNVRTHTTYVDTKNLYKWAFNKFEIRTVVQATEPIVEIPVKLSANKDHVIATPEKDVSLLMPNDIELSSVQKLAHVKDSLDAPVKAGDVIGTLDLKLKDDVLATVNLVASDSVDRSTFLFMLDRVQNFFSLIYVRVAAIVLAILIIAYLIFTVAYNKNRQKSKYKTKRRR